MKRSSTINIFADSSRGRIYNISLILRFSASFKTILLIIFMNQVWKSYFVESRFIQIMFQCRQFTTKIILFFLHLHTSISDINKSFPIFNIIPRKWHYSFNQVFAPNRFVGKIVESAKHKKKGERERNSFINRSGHSIGPWRYANKTARVTSHGVAWPSVRPYKFTLCLNSLCPFIKPLAGVPPPLSRHPTWYNGNGANGSKTKRLWQSFEWKTCV